MRRRVICSATEKTLAAFDAAVVKRSSGRICKSTGPVEETEINADHLKLMN